MNTADIKPYTGTLPGTVTTKAHGTRYNDGKLKWSLVEMDALEPMVRVLMFGAQKYSPRNWMKGLPLDEILDSMQRHINALRRGEELDPESKLPHIGHVACNMMFYSYFTQVKKNNAV